MSSYDSYGPIWRCIQFWTCLNIYEKDSCDKMSMTISDDIVSDDINDTSTKDGVSGK